VAFVIDFGYRYLIIQTWLTLIFAYYCSLSPQVFGVFSALTTAAGRYKVLDNRRVICGGPAAEHLKYNYWIRGGKLGC
jgi:hypothetical protein